MATTSSRAHLPLTYVICAAGLGERFRQYGLNRPKPLLKIHGLSMLERSLESLDILPEDQVLVIALKSHALPAHFRHLPVQWIEIESPTGGQLETFSHAQSSIRHNHVVIYNCDTYFKSSKLRELIDREEYDGIIPCSREPGDAWSFCRVDGNNNVLEVAEKKRISDWASVGYYYFSDKNLLFDLMRQELSLPSMKERYVAPLYERYLQIKRTIQMVPVDIFKPFGTIEQVRDYWGMDLHELLQQNR